jgi:hypothetical protein
VFCVSALRFSHNLLTHFGSIDMTQPPTLFDRIDQAAKLSRQLTGKAAARTVCDAFVAERVADIKALRQDSVSLARYARLVAPTLRVKPAALLAAVRRAGLSGNARDAECSTPAAAGKAETTTPPPAESATPPQPKDRQTASTQDAPPQPAKVLSLPPWADGSDRAPDEAEADYALRKHLEGPPSAGTKAIGESPAERAEALLKSGKLDFGAGGPTESDRKTIMTLIERVGANAVERRIEIERKALPPGGKLYPSKLRTCMTGGADA